MARYVTKRGARYKLLMALPRYALDAILGSEHRPHMMLRADIVKKLIEQWDQIEPDVHQHIEDLFRKAKG